MDLNAIQTALGERGFDAWLFYDHHHRDPIAYKVLGLSEHLMVTRPWFYLIPRSGEPRKLVHRIEAGHPDPLPGDQGEHSPWPDRWDQMQTLTGPSKHTLLQD